MKNYKKGLFTGAPYINFLDKFDSDAFYDFCYSASIHREHHNHRIAILAESKEELIDQLIQITEYKRSPQIVKGNFSKEQDLKPVFVFTGMGPQWWAMGRELYQKEPLFRKTAEHCDTIFKKIAGWSILDEMLKDEEQSRITQTDIAQPANFVFQIALAEIWKSFGIEASACVGHSVGEISSAYYAGFLNLEEALSVCYYRSTIQKQAAGQGAMLACALEKEEAESVIADYEGRVSIAAINSPSSVTLSGDKESLGNIAIHLSSQDIFNKFLRVEVPYHSHYMNPLKNELIESLKFLKPKTPQIPVYSTVTGEVVKGIAYDAQYWFSNVRHPVHFAQAIESLIIDDYRLFIEIGPHPVLSAYIKESLASFSISGDVITSIRRKEPEQYALLMAFGSLYSLGYKVDWRHIYNAKRRYTRIPTYPWQRETFWQETDESLIFRLSKYNHPLLQTKVNSPSPSWESHLNNRFMPFLDDHKIEGLTILPGASYIDLGFAINKEINSNEECIIEDVELFKALIINPQDEPIVRVTYEEKSGEYIVYSQTRTDNKYWTTHATGRIRSVRLKQRNKVDIKQIQQRCDDEIDPKDLYKQLYERGFHYGAYFRGMNRLWHGSKEVFSYIVGHESLDKEKSNYSIHPTLLDTCFQSLLALLKTDNEDSTVYLPVGIKQMVLYQKSLPRKFYSHAYITSWTQIAIEGDIRLYDDEGEVLAEVNGLRCQALNINKGIGGANTIDQWLYDFIWEEQEIGEASSASGKWILFSDQKGFGDKLKSSLFSKGIKEVISVHKGNDYKRIDSETIEIRKNDKSQMKNVLKDADIGNCKGIVYMWALDITEKDLIKQNIAENYFPFFHLIQEMIQTQRTSKPRLFLVTQGVYNINGAKQNISLEQTPLIGINKVTFSEYPDYQNSQIDLDPNENNVSIKQLANEILVFSEENEVAFRGKTRFVHRLVRKSIKTLEEQQISYIPYSKAKSFALEMNSRNNIESLCFREKKIVKLNKDEIEIEVYSARLNYPNLLDSNNGVRKIETLESMSNSILEIAGVVTSVGGGITAYKTGDSVMGLIKGSFGSHVTLPLDSIFLTHKPDVLSYDESVNYPLAFSSVYYALKIIASIQDKERVLIYYGDESMIYAAVQTVTFLGGKIIAASETLEEFEYFQSLGIDHIADLNSQDFYFDINELTEGQGVEVILDFQSRKNKNENRITHIMGDPGRYISFQTSMNEGKDLNLSLSSGKSLIYATVDIAHIINTQPNLFRKLLIESEKIFKVKNHHIIPTKVFKGNEIVDAFKAAFKPNPDNSIVISLQNKPLLSQRFLKIQT